jgi:hypothetical protein
MAVTVAFLGNAQRGIRNRWQSTSAASPLGLRVDARGSTPLAILPRMSLAFARAAPREFSNFGNLHSDGKPLPRLPSLTRDNECLLPFAHKHTFLQISMAMAHFCKCLRLVGRQPTARWHGSIIELQFVALLRS